MTEHITCHQLLLNPDDLPQNVQFVRTEDTIIIAPAPCCDVTSLGVCEWVLWQDGIRKQLEHETKLREDSPNLPLKKVIFDARTVRNLPLTYGVYQTMFWPQIKDRLSQYVDKMVVVKHPKNNWFPFYLKLFYPFLQHNVSLQIVDSMEEAQAL